MIDHAADHLRPDPTAAADRAYQSGLDLEMLAQLAARSASCIQRGATGGAALAGRAALDRRRGPVRPQPAAARTNSRTMIAR